MQTYKSLSSSAGVFNSGFIQSFVNEFPFSFAESLLKFIPTLKTLTAAGQFVKQ